jgi:hypothetical protein
MKAGRPRSTLPVKHRKPNFEAGRYYKRLENLLAKRQKLEMIETLLNMYENLKPLDVEYVRDLKRRANEVRSQLRVLSTTEAMERP